MSARAKDWFLAVDAFYAWWRAPDWRTLPSSVAVDTSTFTVERMRAIYEAVARSCDTPQLTFYGIPIEFDDRMPDDIGIIGTDESNRPTCVLVSPTFARYCLRMRTGVWPRAQRHRNRRRIKLSWLYH